MFINKALIKLAKGTGKEIFITCMWNIIFVMISTGISFCTAMIIRKVLGTEGRYDVLEPQILFVILFALILIQYVILRIKSVTAAKCGVKIKEKVRTRLIEKLFMLGPEYMADKQTGAVATTIFNKVEWLGNYYTAYIPVAVSGLLNAAVLCAFIMRINVTVAFVGIIAMAGILVCPMSFYKAMSKRGKKEWDAEEQYYSDCLEGIQGIVTLKAFRADGKQKNKIHASGEVLRKTVMAQLKVSMIENGLLELFGRIGIALCPAVAAYLAFSGRLDPDVLIYVMFFIGAWFAPMLNLIPAWHVGYKGITASQGIVDLMNATDNYMRRGKISETCTEKSFDEDIHFENVSFAYNEEDGDVLKNINLTLKSGTVTALVGHSGSGKSTVGNILSGFYEVTKGKLKIGDKTITMDNVGDLQKLVSVVWQEGHFFSGSVRDNISVGKPSATDEEIVWAAKQANIHELIESLPKGYDTQLGEDGMRFSGGEKQRIAIARAFLRNTPILILDEATSSLDRKNEREIQESIEKLIKGKTVLVIAHRLSTIQNADCICILSDGEIEAKGTHSELSQNNHTYQKLMGSQWEANLQGGIA
ncbi:ABC transporter ATP-binding protein [Butyrivibrio sp. XB500-5]|uniref:ABC transporter ATP-binding protein/permease n=1 Tax=Butyrivibrio sp. XB500-5 TaxID=2364880 RepID=UPI000EA846B0|nr:ABC transporter ATP-binding protein [Butyrivibrio sp. XB500-5]RKM63321.1 ABC transporter ATP-binding protein [Butyrivibrio sp. XB500-5]